MAADSLPPSPIATFNTYTPHSAMSPRAELSHINHDLSPTKCRSPVKYRLQENDLFANSPPGSPANSTVRVNDGLARAIKDEVQQDNVSAQYTSKDEGMSTVYNEPHNGQDDVTEDDSEFDITLSMDKTTHDDTMGDLSTISAIPTDLTRFANKSTSPSSTNGPDDGFNPRLSRSSTTGATPASVQRPFLLASRNSSSSNEDEEATPRRSRSSADSHNDLLNFTGQSNIFIPPPSISTSRTTRRSPSGRGAFPIRLAGTPSHRSQASVDRERAGGRSPMKEDATQFFMATPANHRYSTTNTTTNGLGLDLLDIDLEPMATPRSIPSVTPRELESLRSELQSRIAGLEATLSGKEAEVMALKRAITDAEVRVGKTSEDLRNERSSKEEAQAQNQDLERRTREMEDVLRELKQDAFIEEREREKLRQQGEEAERHAEDLEVKVLELNASLDTLRTDRLRSSTTSRDDQLDPATPGQNSNIDIDTAVKNATESVARELHALYKSKHERKVADLKLSYERRWLKQVDALKQDLKESQDEVARLLTERDATISGVITPGQTEAVSKMEGQVEELRRRNEEIYAEKRVVEAEVAGLKSEVDSLRKDNDDLRVEVESERAEKGELVAQVEVFLAVSAEQEKVREREREAREEQARQLQIISPPRSQPVSPPRSDTSGDIPMNGPSHGYSSSTASYTSPNKFRSAGPAGYTNGSTTPAVNGSRARPLSMLAKPTTGKFGSGIPAPGMTSGLKAPSTLVRPTGIYGRGNSGLMDGITRMGNGGR